MQNFFSKLSILSSTAMGAFVQFDMLDSTDRPNGYMEGL